MDGTTLEKISEAVHNGWMDAKKAKGVTSRKLDTTGEELLRPYAELSEEAKDLDRGTVRSVLEALPRAGYVIVPGGVAQIHPSPGLPATLPTYPGVEGVPATGQSFGWALKQMQNGQRVQREGWNGKGMYLYLDRGAIRTALTVVGVPAGVSYEPCIVMFTAQGKHQPGWLASQADMLAADWRTVES